MILDGRNADVFSDGLRRPADCRLPTALQPDLPGYLPVPADPNSPGFLKASRADVCLLTNSAGTIPRPDVVLSALRDPARPLWRPVEQ